MSGGGARWMECAVSRRSECCGQSVGRQFPGFGPWSCDNCGRNQLPTLVHPDGLYGGYRLFRFADGFEDFEFFATRGVATVVIDGYSMSTSSLSQLWSSSEVIAEDDGMHTLHLSRDRVAHELDGTKYATRADATRVAYEAGALAFMWYEERRAGQEPPR